MRKKQLSKKDRNEYLAQSINKNLSLQEIGDKLGITRERTRQLFKKLDLKKPKKKYIKKCEMCDTNCNTTNYLKLCNNCKKLISNFRCKIRFKVLIVLKNATYMLSNRDIKILCNYKSLSISYRALERLMKDEYVDFIMGSSNVTTGKRIIKKYHISEKGINLYSKITNIPKSVLQRIKSYKKYYLRHKRLDRTI